MTTNDVSEPTDVIRRRVGIGQHESVITSGVDDVIIGRYDVDVTCGDIESNSRATIPREVGALFQMCHVVGGLEVTFCMKVFS